MFTFSQRKMIKKTKNYDCIVITLSLLAFLGLSETRRFIAKIPSKNLPETDSFEADHQDAVPFEEIQQQLNHPHYRDKRTSNDHVEYSKTFLDDNHNFALIAYSGLVASEVIFLLTYDLNSNKTVTSSDVYQSTDYGKHFYKISMMIGNGSSLLPKVYISSSNHKKVFFINAKLPILYISENEGLSFTSRNILPATIDPSSLDLHPTQDEWLLGLDKQSNTLYVSRDLGKTEFRIVDSNVTFFQWGKYPFDQDNSTVYYVSNNKELYSQQHPYDNFTKTKFDPLLKEYSDFLILGRYIFVAVLSSAGSELTLWVSADRKPFKKAQIPSSLSQEYYIVDSVDSFHAIVIIKHPGNQYNLYLSEEQGIFFYLSLSNLAVEEEATRRRIDFKVIKSLNYTTYIANKKIGDFKGTIISFDAGANWHSLTPPNSLDAECMKPLCSLHLHMSTSKYWRTGVYFQESALGIIMAHGVTGQYIIEDKANMFISRDGGSTWSMTLEGTWDVRILDHGSLIVAVRDHYNDKDKSRTLMYTCTEGLSWSSLTFASSNTTIYGVRTEPGEITTVVNIFGLQHSSWVVFVVDFSNIFSFTCEPENYYNWTPSNPVSSTGCSFGALVTFERRRIDVCCLNGRAYNRIINYKICPCTLEDYECDYGYKHTQEFTSGICVRDESVALNTTCNEDDCSLSRGYRKISGNVCSGGLESYLSPVNSSSICTDPIAAKSDSRYFAPFVIFLLLFLISVLLLVASLLFWKYYSLIYTLQNLYAKDIRWRCGFQLPHRQSRFKPIVENPNPQPLQEHLL